MEKGGMIYSGKAKAVYETSEPNQYVIEYRDDLTALNGAKKGSFEGKGTINNQISALIFHRLGESGIPTHFLQDIGPNETLVKKVLIIPLEVIVRNRAAGSLCKRFGVDQGMLLNSTVLEYCYKNDEYGDPMINEDQIVAFGLADYSQLLSIRSIAISVNFILIQIFREIHLDLVDFKLEFGIEESGKILLADEISPDTCRLWDCETGKSLDKDLFRTGKGDYESAYHEILRRLKDC